MTDETPKTATAPASPVKAAAAFSRRRVQTWREIISTFAFLGAGVFLVVHGEKEVGAMLVAAATSVHGVSVGNIRRQ